jgi:hypothetical protein
MTTKSQAAAMLGRLGGTARAKSLSQQDRAESARKAAEARWAKLRQLKKETAELAKIAQSKAPKHKKITST